MMRGVAPQIQTTATSDKTTARKSTLELPGKIAIADQQRFSSHRCGWNYAIHSLQALHNPDGVIFDGFLESSFFWQKDKQKVPYEKPWVGFLHNPPSMPHWFRYETSPQTLFKSLAWQQSRPYCKGLFCLSQHQAHWLREKTGLPVSALIHPTEIPSIQFNFDRFIANAQKKIVQVGWWLRQLNAIDMLPIETDNSLSYQKAKLTPVSSPAAIAQIDHLTKIEQDTCPPLSRRYISTKARVLPRLSNYEYDQLLTKNIAFVFFHDTSANNAIVECIARATPVVVNPLPAVVEYLGKSYPLYANTLEEAARKVQDISRIKAAHHYLKSCSTRQQLSEEHFRESFFNSEVYQGL